MSVVRGGGLDSKDYGSGRVHGAIHRICRTLGVLGERLFEPSQSLVRTPVAPGVDRLA